MGISLENVAKTFPGGVVGLVQLDLNVEDGELVTLVGESGSGKTTTLRLVAGLERPTRGRIAFDGRDVTRRPPHVRRTALIGQRPVLHPRWTVERHLEVAWSLRHAPAFGAARWWRALGRRIVRGLWPSGSVGTDAPRSPEGADLAADLHSGVSRISDPAYRRRLDEVATTWDVSELLSRRASELSGGEQQRVALARAMMTDPDVYLLDEPFSAVDGRRRAALRRRLRCWQRSTGRPTLYVTHDPVEALALGDRVAVLHAGRIVEVGRPCDVYRRPRCRQAAEALGGVPMNFFVGSFLDGRVASGNSPHTSTPLTSPVSSTHATDAPIACGERLGEPCLQSAGATIRIGAAVADSAHGPLENLSNGLPSGLPDDLFDGASVLTGVRPESIRIAGRPDSSPARSSAANSSATRLDALSGATEAGFCRAAGRVVGVEPHGDGDWLHVELTDAESNVGVANSGLDSANGPGRGPIWLVREQAWSPWTAGRRVELQWSVADMHWFDPATGESSQRRSARQLPP